jgi:hypothetical protein
MTVEKENHVLTELQRLYRPGHLEFFTDSSDYSKSPDDPEAKFEKSIQMPKGKDGKPSALTESDWRNHIRAEFGLSIRLLSIGGKCSFAVIDFDYPWNEQDLLKVQLLLSGSGLWSQASRSSRRGWHLTIYFDQEVDARVLYAVLNHAIKASGIEQKVGTLAHPGSVKKYEKVEIFPNLSGIGFDKFDPGSAGAIKLPLGGKRKSSAFNTFYSPENGKLKVVPDEVAHLALIKVNTGLQLDTTFKKLKLDFRLFREEDLFSAADSKALLPQIFEGCGALKDLLVNNQQPTHSERFAAGTIVVNCNNGIESFLATVRDNPAWNQEISRVNLEQIAKRKCGPITCIKLQNGGVCRIGVHPKQGDKCFEKRKGSESFPSPIRFGFIKAPAAKVVVSPMPLFRQPGEAEEFPFDALGGIAKLAAKTIQEGLGAPGAIIGQCIVNALAMCCQGHGDIMIDGRRILLSIYAVTIAQSGERKSGVDKIVYAEHRKFEADERQKYLAENEEYEIEKEVYEIALADVKKLKKSRSKEELLEAIAGIGKRPRPPKTRDLFVEDFTVEGLVKMMSNNHPSLSLLTDEGGRFYGGHAMNGENQMKTLAILNSIWDNGSAKFTRSGEGTSSAQNKRVSMHLMLQPVVADIALGSENADGQGFNARILFVMPNSTIGDREYRSVNIADTKEVKAFYRQVRQCLERKCRMSQTAKAELDPEEIKLTEEAFSLWRDFYNEVEASLKKGGKYALISAFGAKAAEHCLRLAGILQLFENPGARKVSIEVMRNAIKLMHFYLAECLRLTGIHSIDRKLRLAESLRVWIQNREFIYPGLVYQYGPNQIRNKAAAKEAIDILVLHNWLKSVDSREVDGRRRFDVYQVNKNPIETC